MRIRVKFIAHQKPFELPINYNYHITSLIYHVLASSSQDYSRFLHDEGYRSGQKHFKLFTFSQLLIPKRCIEGDQIVSDSKQMELLISSPIDEFVNHLAYGLLQQRSVKIASADFKIESIETLKTPDFSQEMKFKCLSPIVVSTMIKRDDGLTPYYYRYDDPGFVEGVKKNLLKKYALVYGKIPAAADLEITFDQKYIEQKHRQIYKLIDYKGTKIKGVFAPFVARGAVDLMQIGYEAGFGEKGSMGFGMVEVASFHNHSISC